MARIKTTVQTIEHLHCGNCGVMLAKSTQMFEKCPKCSVVIEP